MKTPPIDIKKKIEWVKETKGKFLVKFKNIAIPIEMNLAYYNFIMKGNLA